MTPRSTASSVQSKSATTARLMENRGSAWGVVRMHPAVHPPPQQILRLLVRIPQDHFKASVSRRAVMVSKQAARSATMGIQKTATAAAMTAGTNPSHPPPRHRKEAPLRSRAVHRAGVPPVRGAVHRTGVSPVKGAVHRTGVVPMARPPVSSAIRADTAVTRRVANAPMCLA